MPGAIAGSRAKDVDNAADDLVTEVCGQAPGHAPHAFGRRPPHDRVLVANRRQQNVDHLLDGIRDVKVNIALGVVGGLMSEGSHVAHALTHHTPNPHTTTNTYLYDATYTTICLPRPGQHAPMSEP